MQRLGLILVFVLALAATLAWIAGREASLQWALGRLTQATHGRLTFEGVRGSLFGAVDIARIRFASTELEASAANASVHFSLLPLLLGKDLVVSRVAVESITLRQTPTDAPLRAPADLALPLAIEIGAMDVKQFSYQYGEFTVRLAALRARFSSTGTRHNLGLEHVTIAGGTVAGSLNMDGVAPFALSGSARFVPAQASRLPAAALTVGGTLLDLKGRLDASAAWLSAQADAHLQPFQASPLRDLAAQISRFDLHGLDASLPHAELKGYVRASTNAESRLTGEIALDNDAAGLLSTDRLPLRRAQSRFDTDYKTLRFDQLELQPLRGASLTGAATLTLERLTAQLAARGLDLSAFHATLAQTALAGTLALNLDPDAQQITARLADRRHQYELDVARAGSRAQIRRAVVRADGGSATAQGLVELTERFPFRGQVRLAQLDPAAFGNFPAARLNGSAEVSGWLKPDWQAGVKLRLEQSRWRGQPLSGQIDATLSRDRVSESRGELLLGHNEVRFNGALGAAADALELDFKLGRIEEIVPRWQGATRGRARLAGKWRFPSIEIEASAEKLRGPQDIRIAALQLNAAVTPEPEAPLRIKVQAKDLAMGALAGDVVNLAVDGNRRRHELQLSAEGKRLALKTKLSGGLENFERWQGRIEQLDVSRPSTVKLEAPAALAVSRTGIEVGAARLTSSGAQFDLAHLVAAPGILRTEGKFSGVPPALFNWPAPDSGIRTTLRFGGDWRIDAAQTVNGVVQVRRESGDIVIGEEHRIEARLREFSLNVTADNNELRADGSIVADKGARVRAKLATRTARDGTGWIIPATAPIALDAEADLPSLEWLGPLIHPSLAIDGRLRAAAQARGTYDSPKFEGRIDGSDLAVSEPRSGARLSKGMLQAHFSEQRLVLDAFQIHGKEGVLTATGQARLRGEPGLQLAFQARQLGLLDRASWDINADADGALTADRREAKLEARIRVNRAQVGLPERSARALSDDIVIKGRTKPAPATPTSRVALDITVDLGNAFRVRTVESAKSFVQTLPLYQNRLDARLAGGVRIVSDHKGAALAKGNVRVVDGAYTFFGKRLEIKRGTFQFDGPLDNPALDILAMNEQTQVKVGASVSGTALNPHVRLVSDPEVSEQEKLSWLLFGRGGQSVDSSTTGSPTAVSGVAAFSFQLSDNLFVGIEHGAIGASNVLTFYTKLTQRLSVEARTGNQNGLRLFYTYELPR